MYQRNSSDPVSPTDFNPQDYVYIPGYSNTYYTQLGNSNYKAQWVSMNIVPGSTTRPQQLGFSGIFLDNFESTPLQTQGNLVITPAVGMDAYQGFAHSVTSATKPAGLLAIGNGAGRNYTSGEGALYYNPAFLSAAAASFGLAANANFVNNSRSSVPDVFFQEEAFFWGEHPTETGIANQRNQYVSSYWLATLADIDSVAASNASYPSSPQYYFAQVHGWDRPNGTPSLGDNTPDPAYGIDGWMRFGLCSYLVGENNWTVLGNKNLSLSDPMSQDVPDFDITALIGVPNGTRQQVGQNPYLQYRNFIAAPSVTYSRGGVVVVNGNDSLSNTYVVPSSLVDELGNVYTAGNTITLQPHTGRILLNAVLSPSPNLAVSLVVPASSIVPGQVISISVQYTNNGLTSVNNVQINAVVPSNTLYVAGSAEATGGVYNAATNTVTWIISTVAAGQTGSRTFQATVD